MTIRQEIFDEIRALVFLKGLVVKYQHYELAAMLRDSEKKLYSQYNINESELKNVGFYDDDYTIEQYSHIRALISKFKNHASYPEFSDKTNEEMRKLTESIRNKKIDEILPGQN